MPWRNATYLELILSATLPVGKAYRVCGSLRCDPARIVSVCTPRTNSVYVYSEVGIRVRGGFGTAARATTGAASYPWRIRGQ
jgi:hypothetical protein